MPHWKRKAVLFLASQAVTLFGSSLVQFAIVWYVTLKTSSGAWVSALTLCSFLPQFLISFVSGVWADRYSRKTLIILSDASIAIATLALALLLPRLGEGTGPLVALLAASLLRSLGAGVQTPAVNAMIPDLVPAEHLMRYNSVNATLQSAVQFAAPAAAGALLTFSSLRGALLIDIGTAIVGIGLLACIALPLKKPEARADSLSVFSEMKQGFRYALHERRIGRILSIYGIFIFLCVPAGFLATLFVSRYYGDSYWYLTLVELVGFAGMAGGGLLLGVWGGFSDRAKTLAVGMLIFGLLAVGMGLAQSFIVYLVLMAIYGIALTAVQTASTTMLQEDAAPEMQGRVFGFFGAMYSGFLPLGMAVFGPLADAVSLRLLMLLSGVLLLPLALFAFLGLRRKKGNAPDVSPQ